MSPGEARRAKGAVNELKAAIWYIDNGYQIFFPAGDGGIVDFVAYKPGERPRLVQVKTAHWITSNGHRYLQLRIGRTRGRDEPRDWDPDRPEDQYDDLFVVYEDQKWLVPREQFPVGKKTLYFGRGDGGKTRMGYDSDDWLVE